MRYAFYFLAAWCLVGSTLAAPSTSPGTYYIDFVGGSDANSGSSKASPWKLAPAMQGFGGSYRHQAGDHFIFRGGVTWPAGAFPMTVSSGGASGNPDYYGVDTTWHTGSSWARPIFDDQNAVRQDLITVGGSYVTFDNLEMMNVYWDQTITSWEVSFINLEANTYITIQNCYFHHWSHSSTAQDLLNVVVSGGRGPYPGNLIQNCIFDGESSGSDSGAACYHGVGIVRNSIARNMSNGFLIGGGDGTYEEVSGCNIGPINVSFGGRHENGIENQDTPDSIKIFNNYIHDCVAVVIFLGGNGTTTANTYYVYNNVMYATNVGTFPQPPIRFDARYGSVNGYVYNNTLVTTNANSIIFANNSPPTFATYLDSRNNHFITDIFNGDPYGGITPNIDSNNVQESSAQATSLEYTESNLYQPTSATSPTIGAGANLTSLSLYTTDILGVARPASGVWDAGAYEYTGTAVLTAIRVTPPTATVAPGGNQSFTAQGLDQFGNPMNPTPTFTWMVSGGGTLTATGEFTAGSTPGGPFTVTASSGAVSGTGTVTVASSTSQGGGGSGGGGGGGCGLVGLEGFAVLGVLALRRRRDSP